MKKNKRLHALGNRSKFKIVLIMKLITPLLFIFMLQFSVSAHSQNKITVNFKNTELSKAITLIESKTDYRFVYNNNLIPGYKKIDANFREADLQEVMTILLSGTGLSYQMMKDNLVVLFKAEENKVQADVKVSGKVTDENDSPLAGASVKVKGGSKGVSTTITGEYALTVPDNATLVVSYVGYETKEVVVGVRTEINVQLSQSIKVSDQVVVIGYGTQRRKDLTGSVGEATGFNTYRGFAG
jgi:hypothetical protein